MPHRHKRSDAAWARLQPLLPPRKPGKPRQDDRRIINGILWRLATGAPWRDLPERYGPWQTVYPRCWRWTRAGVWDQILTALQRAADARGAIDWTSHFVDSTVVRAHQPAAGAKGGTPPPKRSAGVRAAARPRSISGPRVVVSR